jgi:hypothetical protein
MDSRIEYTPSMTWYSIQKLSLVRYRSLCFDNAGGVVDACMCVTGDACVCADLSTCTILWWRSGTAWRRRLPDGSPFMPLLGGTGLLSTCFVRT